MSLNLKPPGEWMYNQEVVQWLYEPSCKNQLPLSYQLFATYCQLLGKLNPNKTIPLGRVILQNLLKLENKRENFSVMSLQIDSLKVFVNFQDPRLLNVPNQLRDRQIKNILQTFLAAGYTFIDVGANYGVFSILASTIVGEKGKVIAVEPQKILAQLVHQSLAANNYSSYEVLAIACGDAEGEVDFYIPQGSSGEGGIFAQFSGRSSHQKVSVPLRRFDDSIDWQNLPGKIFIKLDVEGSELAFLKGAERMLTTLKPPILMELNPLSMQAANVTVEQLIEQLQSLGYTTFAPMIKVQEKQPLSQLQVAVGRDVIII